MDKRKVNRLNTLFEKMVSDDANINERRELDQLYQEYINDGRDHPRRKSLNDSFRKIAMN
ncbi:hypothetical protein tinsulaeT_14310 [Thalassotalea insulae]|uniref:Uncharacterized protein n=1 Tax=Thalassotalea insulae TaxID=2056778 RepID=A0ABQ6GTT3_9GAMM|nr:hypothetical protein [Thalassotalea insulae]GLX78091.1 hypothetical protein tinsulaeT_14310 [Thalassotalea insulae]